MVRAPDRTLRILHLIVRIGAPNSQYNEHCLPVLDKRDLVLCSFFKASIRPPPGTVLIEGDGTVRGFWRALKAALDLPAYDVIHAHAPTTGAFLIAAKLRRGASLANAVYTVHNSFHNYRLRNRLLMYAIFAFIPTVVLCSDAVLDSLPPSLRFLRRGRLLVVPNGVDTDRVDRSLADTEGGRSNGGFKVVSVARLIERKNPTVLLSAFARDRGSNGSLIYVGDGHLFEDLAAQAERLGVTGSVTFTGLIGREDVYRQLLEADLYVSPSSGEGLPVAVLEAMACRRPVILSDIPPHREIVGDAEFIPLISPNDVAGFAREMQRFERMGRDKRAEIGRRCRELVQERFSLHAMHRSYEEIYVRVKGQATRTADARSHAREEST